MKKHTTMTRLLSIITCVCMIIGMAVSASASSATPLQKLADSSGGNYGTSVIDPTKTGSLEIYAIDWTNAAKDGVWDDSYISTGLYDSNVYDTLIKDAVRAGDDDNESVLGNEENSNGYAIKGAVFTYLKVANIVTFSKYMNGANQSMVLYGIDLPAHEDLLDALKLTADNRFAPADGMEGIPASERVYFTSDVLANALRDALNTNATATKNALEKYIAQGTAMPETDANGHTAVDGLELGLYMIVQTAGPEYLASTVNPFFVSLPMTTVNGNNANNGGESWLYDVVLFPKNETSIPSLEKTVRETMDDTGKNTNTPVINDGFADNATASTGDIVEYQIISTLPSITSDATALTHYNFTDVLASGLTYKDDVVIELFRDMNCTDKIVTWTKDEQFTVEYNTENGANEMYITITEAGLAEINSGETVWENSVKRGYSDCTIRITYTAEFNADNTFVYGDTGNKNTVTLVWKRTSTEYYDTLIDDAHVYSYGLDLTKAFSDNAGNYDKVNFVLWNNTDGYWVKAELNAEEGVYYVIDHMVAGGVSGHEDGAAHADQTAEEAAIDAGATIFVPVESNGVKGKIIIKGLEDDEYILTETRTDNGYTLLKDHITIVISAAETEAACEIYAEDILGVLQNDPRYANVINSDNLAFLTLGLGNNIPQKQLGHKLLTASATVDGNAVTMQEDNSSVNALAPMYIVNTHGFKLPQTGAETAELLPIIGASVIGVCAVGLCVLFLLRRKEEEDEQMNNI